MFEKLFHLFFLLRNFVTENHQPHLASNLKIILHFLVTERERERERHCKRDLELFFSVFRCQLIFFGIASKMENDSQHFRHILLFFPFFIVVRIINVVQARTKKCMRQTNMKNNVNIIAYQNFILIIISIRKRFIKSLNDGKIKLPIDSKIVNARNI